MRIFQEDKISLIITMLILFLFVVSTLLFSQTNDFLISSEDNSPSTIIQSSPKLHPFNSGKFITSWKDSREGEVSTYAQWFDSLGNKLGNNFKIFADEQIVFNSDGTFITVNETYNYVYTYSIYSISASIFKDTIGKTNEFSVFSLFGADGFDIDPIGLDFLSVAVAEKFIFFINLDGYITIKTYDLNGQQLISKNLIDQIPFRSSALAAASDNKNNLLLASFNARNRTYNGSENDSIPLGIYINIFDSDDSIRVQNKLIKEFTAPYESYYVMSNSPLLRCISHYDSTWQIFWLDKDSKRLSYITVNSKGENVTEIQTIDFPESMPNITVNSFSVSQMHESKFAIFLSTNMELIWPVYFHALLTFNNKGEYLEMHSLSVGAYSPLPYSVNNIFLNSDTTFFTTSETKKDVFVNNINTSFKALSSQKINDDSTGSNDYSPLITVIDENRYFVSWTNETRTFGLEVDKNGNITQSKKEFEARKFFFFPNGKCYNLWTRDTLIGDILTSHQGYTVYNNYWEVLQRDTLERYNYGGSQNPDILRLNDTTFVMYYTSNTNGILILLNKEGHQIKTTSINLDVGGELKLFAVNETKFLLSRSNKNQYFNEDLEPVSEVFILDYDLYIGNNKFLLLDKYSSDSRIFALIIDSSGNQYNRFQLVDNYFSYYNKFDVIRLPGSGFAYLFYSSDKIYTASFTSEGNIISKPFLIHDNNALPGMDASLVFNKNQAFFAWNDARNPDKGFDIYGRIINAGKLTPVKEEVINTPARYQLFQNYPNPFNPATTITYSIPENSKVELRVFDLIGREVAVLVNEEKPAGEHNITFNASHLVSGVYIYKLRAGAFTQTRKMILLK